jgi:hypothetical protein
MLRFLLIPIFLVIAGCVQIPPSPQEIQAKRFESAPGKAVIYVVRGHPDLYGGHGSLALDDTVMFTTMAGNFFRWEVTPGAHRIVGMGPDLSRMTINAEAGKIYFIQHVVTGYRGSTYGGSLHVLSEREGRLMVQRATLIGG